MSFFSWNSPLAQAIGKATDLFILNVLCFLCSIPVVTAGAAMTAKYSVAMKILRKEEPAVFKAYFKAFAENFKVSTICWLIELAVIAFFVFDWNLIIQQEKTQVTTVFMILLGIFSFIVLASVFNTFAFIARFEMKIAEYLKASVILTLLKIPRMILALILIAAPYVLAFFYIRWLPAVVAVIPMLELYFNGMMYVKEFRKLEEKMPGNQKAGGTNGKEDNETEETKEPEDEKEDSDLKDGEEQTESDKAEGTKTECIMEESKESKKNEEVKDEEKESKKDDEIKESVAK